MPRRLDAPATSKLFRMASANTNQLGVLFLHHNLTPVVLNNLRSIQRHNPDAVVATISASEALPDGYTLEATPDLQHLHSAESQRSSDRLACSWFLQRREQCDKWWIVEWDTFCTMPVREYYAPVWRFPFVASNACLRHRQPEWHWFRSVKDMPEEYRPHATGAVPFLYLVGDAALRAICEMLIEQPVSVGNGELRFATAARRCGYAPCGFSPPEDQITWMKVQPSIDRPGIFHSVKHLVELPVRFVAHEC